MKNLMELKKKIIKGTFIDLVPLTQEHLNDIVNLRNQEKNRYFLNQQSIIDYNSQLKWYNDYLKRETDIYWAIYNKNNQFIGTIRIYDIDFNKDICEQGSFMIDSKFSVEAPYAVEAELLSLDFAFYELEIKDVINKIREDNKIMNNLGKKIGFKFIKNILINQVKYNYYILKVDDYEKNRDKFINLIKLWNDR